MLSGIDVTQPQSLTKMAASTALVLNCVGPYRHYGEPVVKACVEAGTDYLDVCGEPGAHWTRVPSVRTCAHRQCRSQSRRVPHSWDGSRQRVMLT